MIIIPRIEYQLQAVVLTKQEYKKLMTRINRIVKHSANLANQFQILLFMKKIYMD